MDSKVYTISSTPVTYPYKAYPSQIGMIDRVIKGLQRNHNCLIESPTGSGKSLALLCAVLAWRENEYVKVEKDIIQTLGPAVSSVGSANSTNSPALQKVPANGGVIDLTSDDPFADCCDDERFIDLSESPSKTSCPDPSDHFSPEANKGDSKTWTDEEIREKVWEARKRIPKIFFGTRTHKQLAQLVSELKKTHYANVKMTILASRDQTCINPEVRNQPNRGEACRLLLNPYTNQLTGTCKFHAKWKRQFQKPYSLRGVIRREHRMSDIGGTVCNVWDIEDLVRVGENHGFCPYYASSNTLLTDAELVFCPYNYLIDPEVRRSVGLELKEQIIILDEAHNMEDACREAASFVFSKSELQVAADCYLWAAEAESYGPAQEARLLYDVCIKVVHWMDEIVKGTMTTQSHSVRCREWQGRQFIDILAKLGLFQDVGVKLEEAVKAVAQHDEGENGDNNRRGPDGLPMESFVPGASLKAVEKLALFLNYFYRSDPLDYRMCLKEDTNADGQLQPPHFTSQIAITLHMWCMNPAVAFADVGLVAKSVILASGTLAPMKTFEVELGARFNLQLEATHVLPKERMFIISVPKGPSGRSLRVTYQNTSQWAFQDELGQLLIDVCETVPYGVLCFFPSYKLLDTLYERWKSTGALCQLSERKVVIVEPKTSEKLNKVMDRFYKAVQKPSKFGSSCTGAVFLAVCRGKVSEGLDFADNNARAVITIGIPYPNVNCLEVAHKRSYNDERVSRKASTLNGDQWYEIQAYRALNQALGRCLRHRQDWGALILVDERFGMDTGRYCSGLSRWIRENISHYKDFKTARSDLQSFTQRLLGEDNSKGSTGQRSSPATMPSSSPATIPSSSQCKYSSPVLVENPIDAGDNFTTPTLDTGVYATPTLDTGVYATSTLDTGVYATPTLDTGVYALPTLDTGVYTNFTSPTLDIGVYTSAVAAYESTSTGMKATDASTSTIVAPQPFSVPRKDTKMDTPITAAHTKMNTSITSVKRGTSMIRARDFKFRKENYRLFQ